MTPTTPTPCGRGGEGGWRHYRPALQGSGAPAPVDLLAEVGDAVDLGEGVGGGRTEEDGSVGG
jgi:hypothetical protein